MNWLENVNRIRLTIRNLSRKMPADFVTLLSYYFVDLPGLIYVK